MSKKGTAAKAALARKAGTPRGGRPSLLTAESEETLIDQLQRGAWIGPACRAAGISRTAFYEWKALGILDPNSVHGAFWKKVQDALAFHEARAISVVSTEADTNAEVMLKFMRIRHRKRWGESRMEVTGKGGGPIAIENKTPEKLLAMSATELAEYLSKLADDLRPKDPS